MNDPTHQQRLKEIRDEYLRLAHELRCRGEFEQMDSQPRGGHTSLRFIPKRSRDMKIIETQMRKWHSAHFDSERESVKFSRHGSFTIVRSKCVYCNKSWAEHVPSGGQCVFMSTTYKELPRKGAHAPAT